MKYITIWAFLKDGKLRSILREHNETVYSTRLEF